MATTAAATAATSYLQYYFHYRATKLKPVIEWV
jgi:hypothetical protein